MKMLNFFINKFFYENAAFIKRRWRICFIIIFKQDNHITEVSHD